MKMNTANGKSLNIAQVALELGVSPATVSMAFSGKGTLAPARREAVLKAARELGYQPNPLAQRLAQGRDNKTIALFLPGLDAGATIYKVQHIQTLLNERGYRVQLHSRPYQKPEQDDDELMRVIRMEKPRALIVNAGWYFGGADEKELREYIAEGGDVVVLAEGKPLDLACDQVVKDEAHSLERVLEYLVAKGHRDIGFLSKSPLLDLPSHHAVPRVFGELAARPEWEFSTPGLYYDLAGREAAQQFLALKQRPTAVVADDDAAATAFLNTVTRAGVLVPRDVSLVARQDSDRLECALVPITTVTNPYRAHGEYAVKLLLERLSGEYSGEPRTEWVQGELIERESVAPPR
jgi:DNA-binding LacI/PurR family transcriptional regulator